MSHDKFLKYEEEFHNKDRKVHRKERKLASQKDRSKFKVSDQKKQQLPSQETDEGQEGLVLAVTSEGILVDATGVMFLCSLKGILKKERTLDKNLIVVGDEVLFAPQTKDTGVILQIKNRRSVLSRADNLSRKKQQLIAANIDQLLITTSVLTPPLKPPLIDRYIIAARKGNLRPILIINKIDLLENPPKEISLEEVEREKKLYEELITIYTQLGIPVFPVSTTKKEGLEPLKAIMQNTTSVFSGQSGVGKSSLINLLIGANLAIGEVVEKTSKGSHTTTTAHLLPLEGGGFCIDTPGIKSFGIWDIDKSQLQEYFPEISSYALHCKFPDCSHRQEPGCAVIEAAEKNLISSLRFASYCALIEDLSKEHQHR